MPNRIAVVLFNLGGPDGPDAVQPFLFNLFNDRAIIELPNPLRWFLAKLISKRRAPIAREIYEHLGGGSPLLKNTQEQAEALESALQSAGSVRCFIAMRYWHPRADETAEKVAAFAPDRIVLLPLYPQYSGTTTGSSLLDWHGAAKRAGITAPTTAICCYAENDGFITSTAALVRKGLEQLASSNKAPRVLFTAHGLPQKIVDKGDPYQWQVERTAAAIVQKLAIDGLDWRVCYQSRVGPMVWLQPYTEDELKTAGAEKIPLVVVPIAFTSEHSETLVELDIEYRELAEESGVPEYLRVPTVSVEDGFIDGLAVLVRRAVDSGASVMSESDSRLCPAQFGRCAFAQLARNGNPA